jgi:triosephosphate isomerase
MNAPRPLLVANWKANLAPAREAALAAELVSRLAALPAFPEQLELLLAPSTLGLTGVARELAGTPIGLAAQDCSAEVVGAHTGDAPAEHLATVAGAVLIGHAERRRSHGEHGELLGRKAARAATAGLRPILCLDDLTAAPLAGRGSALADEWRAFLLGALQSGCDRDALIAAGLIIAYEPTSAIGSGEALAPSAAQEAAAAIRTIVGVQLPVLYGGSVTDTGAETYLAPTSDPSATLSGLLVGGASLTPSRLLAIISTLTGAAR